MLKLPDGTCLRFASNPFAASESRPWRSRVRADASVVPPPEGGAAGCVATGRGAAMDALGAGVAGGASDGGGGASDAASSGGAEGATLGVVGNPGVGAAEGRVGAAAVLPGAPPR